MLAKCNRIERWEPGIFLGCSEHIIRSKRARSRMTIGNGRSRVAIPASSIVCKPDRRLSTRASPATMYVFELHFFLLRTESCAMESRTAFSTSSVQSQQ